MGNLEATTALRKRGYSPRILCESSRSKHNIHTQSQIHANRKKKKKRTGKAQ
jgi:hypothetical protein